jgi:hypothetical protein
MVLMHLHLENNHLNRTIPPEISNLPYLVTPGCCYDSEGYSYDDYLACCDSNNGNEMVV